MAARSREERYADQLVRQAFLAVLRTNEPLVASPLLDVAWQRWIGQFAHHVHRVDGSCAKRPWVYCDQFEETG